jgi:hypothetical protein
MAALATPQAGAARAPVGELEAAVLVVGVAGQDADVDLVEVVLARVLDEDAGLEVWRPRMWVRLSENVQIGPPRTRDRDRRRSS